MSLAKKRSENKQTKSKRVKITNSDLKNTKIHSFPIIAIGASAGGLEAMERFFSHIPTETGMAYVVITHLDPDHASMMTELLKKYTPMPVLTICENTEVMQNTIYVTPPGKNISITNGFLHLTKQVEPHYSNLPISFFFKALALDKAENAVAIILSGAGTDGSLGARDIKSHGGIVIAQDPFSAKFDSMPTSIINAGLADFILSPEQMPEQLIRWAYYGDIKDGRLSLELQHIFTLIRAKTGYDFSSYKLNTICRRIDKQMHIHHLELLSDYVALLRKNTKEVDKLFKSLLIGVTRFFRDPHAFEIFKNEILPQLFSKSPVDYCIRVWVPGCSTGEEVYSIAIMIAEYFVETGKHCFVQIFGTDIDKNALIVARSGIYPDTIAQDIDESLLKRYFTREKNQYKIKKEIRSMVIFGEQNLIKDPPFTKVDIISCRNLLIYLNMKLQKKILPIFYYSLKPKGVLFLGMSESIAGQTELFKLINKDAKFFEKKNVSSSHMRRLTIPEISPYTRERMLREQNMMTENAEMYVELKKFIMNKFTSPCLLIDKNGDIICGIGKIDHFLKFSLPLENVNVLDVVLPDIKKILKSAIEFAKSKDKENIYHNLTIHHDGLSQNINLRVLPITDFPLLNGMLLIVFEEPLINTVEVSEKRGRTTQVKKKDELTNLKIELRYTKDNLQSTIEELESSNEELQSMNEELQSTNEELETSKEELHSLNEELVIMNTELQNRIDQLSAVHDDMANLFNSTDIATLFLDNNLCIKRYTPKALDFIHLIPSDIGRSINHFATNIKYERLTEDAEEVLKKLNQKVIEVQSKSNRWFLIHILPYRTLTNVIDGVVITFTDITEHKESEKKYNQLNAALQNALYCSKNIIDTIMVPLIVLSLDLKIISVNRAVYKNFHLLPEDIIGRKINSLPGWNIPELITFLNQPLPEEQLVEGYEIKSSHLPNNLQKITVNARKIYNQEHGADVILLALELK